MYDSVTIGWKSWHDMKIYGAVTIIESFPTNNEY